MTVALQAGGVDAASVLGDLHRISVTQWRELRGPAPGWAKCLRLPLTIRSDSIAHHHRRRPELSGFHAG
jgi:hypothetical protein